MLRLGQTTAAIEFRCRLKYQLLIPMFLEGSRCPRCAVLKDRWGDHAVQWGWEVANTFWHNAVRNMLLGIGRELSLPVGRERPFPVQVPGLETRRADLVIWDWEHGRDSFVDVEHRLWHGPIGWVSSQGGLWLRQPCINWLRIGTFYVVNLRRSFSGHSRLIRLGAFIRRRLMFWLGCRV